MAVPTDRQPRSTLRLSTRRVVAVGVQDRLGTERRDILLQPVHPHLFRDCAATSIATSDPEHVRIILSVLQHSTLRTSERHYNHARGIQATGKMQDHVLALRRAAEATQRGRRPRPRRLHPLPPRSKDKP